MIEPNQLLIIGAIGVFALYIFRLRSILLDRLIYLFLLTAGLIFTVHPPLSSWLAARVGIGRGVDLIIYVFIIFALFQMASTSSHSLKQDRQITILVRECAILGAIQGVKSPSDLIVEQKEHATPSRMIVQAQPLTPNNQDTDKPKNSDANAIT